MCRTLKEQQKLLDYFIIFVNNKCIIGPNKNVHIQKLESAFAYYLDENNIDISTFWSTNLDTINIVNYK